MKSLKASKKLMAILAISLAASLAVPYALASYSFFPPAPTPVIPSQCTAAIATGWSTSPIINARMNIRNAEDKGTVGYWALDSYVESFVIWQNTGTTPNTFCALLQYSGTWRTFAGALSPQNGTSQAINGAGNMEGAIVKILTGSFLGPYCKPTATKPCTGTHSKKPLNGLIGTFNFGGNQSQIMLGTYANQKAFNPTNFLTFYFATGYTITSQPIWSFIYIRSGGVGYGNMWVDDLAGSFGDIVT